jgi:hypothetical protein
MIDAVTRDFGTELDGLRQRLRDSLLEPLLREMKRLALALATGGWLHRELVRPGRRDKPGQS